MADSTSESQKSPPNFDVTDIDPGTGYPKLPQGWAWNQFPWAPAYSSDPEWYDTLGRNALEQRQIFSLSTIEEQVEQSLKLLQDFPTRGLDIMFAAAVKGNAAMIRALLEAGVKAHPEIDTDDDMTLVPLHAAAANNNLECLEVLLQAGDLDVNSLDDLGGTALMRASWRCHPAIVQYLLLEKNADPTIRQNIEPYVSALEFAAGQGQLEIARMLLDQSSEKATVSNEKILADLEAAKIVSVTPLALAAAASHGDVETFRFMLEHGGYPTEDRIAEWDMSTEQKIAIESAIARAAKVPHIAVLDILFRYLNHSSSLGEVRRLELSANLLDEFINGMFNAVSSDNLEGLEYNWNVIFNLNQSQQNQKGQITHELFSRAAQQGSLLSTKFLLEKHDANVNFLHRPGLVTALYTAAANNHISVVRYLLESQKGVIDIHIASGKFANGATALWIATEQGYREIVELLLHHGGPVMEALDSIQLDALERGEEEGRLEVAVTRKGVRAPVMLRLTMHNEEERLNAERDEKSVSISVKSADANWLRKLEIRRQDEELANDGSGRELKTE